MPVQDLWMAQPATAEKQDQDGPDPPPPLTRQKPQAKETQPHDCSDHTLLFAKQRVYDVAPIELSEREQIEHGHEDAHPPRKSQGTQVNGSLTNQEFPKPYQERRIPKEEVEIRPNDDELLCRAWAELTDERCRPTMSVRTAITKPAHGPAAPTSKSWRRSTIGLRRRMKAPNVPTKFTGHGAGRKYGGDALIL